MIVNRWMRVYREKVEDPKGNGGEPTVKPTEEVVKPVDTPPVEVPKDDPKDQKPTEKPTETEIPKQEDKSKLGQVTSLVEQSGLDMKEVAEYAKANSGEVDLETMVALKEKHGEAIASLIADQIKGIHKERSEAASKRDTEVFDQVKESLKDVSSDPEQTGESMWQELATWSKDNVSNEHRTEINKLLAQGGLAAKLAVQELTSAFKESLGNQEFQDADLLEADTVAQQSAGGLISKSDYNRELNELLKKGHVYGDSAEIRKLDARRAKSIQRGY